MVSSHTSSLSRTGTVVSNVGTSYTTTAEMRWQSPIFDRTNDFDSAYCNHEPVLTRVRVDPYEHNQDLDRQTPWFFKLASQSTISANKRRTFIQRSQKWDIISLVFIAASTFSVTSLTQQSTSWYFFQKCLFFISSQIPQ